MSYNLNIIKRVDIFENKEEIPPLKDERANFFQNKMMKFYKIIKDKENQDTQIIFMSDNKGSIYIYEINKQNLTKIGCFDSLCNDSKYILVDIIKSTKFDFFISLNLNPCLNIFKLKENKDNNQKEIENLYHLNLKQYMKKSKYNKIFELNTSKKDYLILFSEEKIELWANNNNKGVINYERRYILKLNDNNEDINNEIFFSNKISNICKADDDKLVLFLKDKLEFINIKINEDDDISSKIEIENKINIKGINYQFEKIISLFIEPNNIFLGLIDTLALVSVPYGEKIQIYKIGKVLHIRKINDNNDIMVFIETKENEFYFIKYKFDEYNTLKEEKRMKYDKWIYKFDTIQNGEIIIIYDIKGFMTLLKFN